MYPDGNHNLIFALLKTVLKMISKEPLKPVETAFNKRRHTLDWKASSFKRPAKRNSLDEGCSKSDSVRHLIEQVKNTLNAIEDRQPDNKWDQNVEKKQSYQNVEKKQSWQYEMYQFDSSGGEFSRHCPERASTGQIKNVPQSSYAKLHSGTKSVATLVNLKEYEHKRYSTKRVIFVGSDKTLNEAHKRAFKAAGGKIFHKKDGYLPAEGLAKKTSSNLRIRIAKSPIVTDSSNEYETETGIPRSPTLYISGVSISRTPEPCSPANLQKRSPERKRSRNLSNLHGKINSYPVLNFIPVSADETLEGIFPPEQFDDRRFLSSGRQSRSSSLTVPKTCAADDGNNKKLNTSCGALPISDGRRSHGIVSTPPLPVTPRKGSEGLFSFGVCSHKNLHHGSFKTIPSVDAEDGTEEIKVKEPNKAVGKSKSAAEPERERQVFRFPKSSTDGALSSVLHVQESNLSSDDFHEVLFLLERSPKQSSKRRKRSKKERDKVKEALAGMEDGPALTEANSAI